nr:MAG TPA: hypothetical protein [Caudoviricetes sp.]
MLLALVLAKVCEPDQCRRAKALAGRGEDE